MPEPRGSALAYRPVITLSQLPGARGHDLALRLCDDLRYVLLDREIIHAIAGRAHVGDRVVAALDEQERPAVEELLASMRPARPLGERGYFEHLVQVVRAFGRRGGAVIVGRGAHLILGPGEALRVLVEAPREFRVAAQAERDQVPFDEAVRRVAAAEAARRKFLREHFQAEADDHEAFDLAVNTRSLGLDGAAAAIEAALFSRAGRGR
jgi:hypothetical protein